MVSGIQHHSYMYVHSASKRGEGSHLLDGVLQLPGDVLVLEDHLLALMERVLLLQKLVHSCLRLWRELPGGQVMQDAGGLMSLLFKELNSI